MKRELQNIAFSIFKQCLLFNIFLDVARVPKLLNTEADFYSKIFDYDDWEIIQFNINTSAYIIFSKMLSLYLLPEEIATRFLWKLAGVYVHQILISPNHRYTLPYIYRLNID